MLATYFQQRQLWLQGDLDDDANAAIWAAVPDDVPSSSEQSEEEAAQEEWNHEDEYPDWEHEGQEEASEFERTGEGQISIWTTLSTGPGEEKKWYIMTQKMLLWQETNGMRSMNMKAVMAGVTRRLLTRMRVTVYGSMSTEGGRGDHFLVKPPGYPSGNTL
jgi:hypothetical protein